MKPAWDFGHLMLKAFLTLISIVLSKVKLVCHLVLKAFWTLISIAFSKGTLVCFIGIAVGSHLGMMK